MSDPRIPSAAKALSLLLLAMLVAPSLFSQASPPADPGTREDALEIAARHDQGRYIAAPGKVLPYRQRAEVINRIVEDRLLNLLPQLMRETGIDMWLVLNREYAEDPVYFSLVPQPSHAARRTTMLVFHDKGEGDIDRLTVNRYPLGSLYEAAWEGGDLEDQWKSLGELIAERNPKKIGVNVSRHWPVADGLTAALHERLMDVLTPELKERVTSAEDLVIRWIETRSEMELDIYPSIVALARSVISEAFSDKVIQPGHTTTDDVAWYIRERYSQLELPIWFQPSVDLQRKGMVCEDRTFCGEEGDSIIQRGDILHCDVGICYLGLCTDTQEMGYVLRNGESQPPREILEALSTGNRWQDILTSNYVTGRTGNEILKATIQQAESEGHGDFDLHPSARHLRPLGRPDHRYVGQPGRHPGTRRLEALSQHPLRHRG